MKTTLNTGKKIDADSRNTSGPWVGFDVDEVLANLRDGLARQMTTRFGKDLDWRQWHDYSFFLPHMSQQEFYGMIMEDRLLEQCQPEPGAVGFLNSLKQAGFNIALITSRGFHPNAHSLTKDWLETHEFDVDFLHVVPHGQGKSDVVLGLPNVLAYVDDYLGHLDDIDVRIKAMKSSKSSFGSMIAADPLLCVMDRPWNQHDVNGHRRVRSVSEFHDIVLEEFEKKNREAFDV